MKLKLAAALLAFAFVLGGTLAPAWAASDRYELKVTGLDCPVCAQGLQRKLGALPHVKDVKVDARAGKATFHVENGAVSEQQVRQTVTDAGFVPGELTVSHDG